MIQTNMFMLQMPTEIQSKEAEKDQVPNDETENATNGKDDKKNKRTPKTIRAGKQNKTPLTELTNEQLITIINENEATTMHH